jgi:hypothetical protein
MSRRHEKRRARQLRNCKSIIGQMATGQTDPAGVEVSTTQQSPTRVTSPLLRYTKRRLPVLVALIGIVAIAGIWLTSQKEKTRMGIIEYSSDDPNAQVILEKDGQDIPLDRGSKYTKELEPGSYKLRLAGTGEGLKLSPPNMINLDPGGRAFVTVRRDPKAVRQ